MMQNLFIDVDKKTVCLRVPYITLEGEEEYLWKIQAAMKSDGLVFIFGKNKLDIFIDLNIEKSIPENCWITKSAYLDKDECDALSRVLVARFTEKLLPEITKEVEKYSKMLIEGAEKNDARCY
jgi:hypothetical protein